jgi:rhodanese-related sulfurtransferase
MRLRGSKNVIVEALIVTAAGLGLALVLNLFSPRGLSLTRNYFPAAHAANPPGPTNAVGQTPAAITATSLPPAQVVAGATNDVAQRLRDKGLQVMSDQDAFASYRDLLYQQGLFVFVDARDDRHYERGHVPGAYQFDRYYPDKYLPIILPVCLNANRIVVYCTGGACEDSEFAALALIDAGIPRERVFIFAGGITEWTAQRWPVEVGARGAIGAAGQTPDAPPNP